MPLLASVLNAECAAGTAMFDNASLHTADPGATGANEDLTAGQKVLSWGAPSGGVSTASATWAAITGTWTHIGLWNSATFVGSVARDIDFDVADDLVVAFQHSVVEDA